MLLLLYLCGLMEQIPGPQNSHKGEFYEIENLESEGAKLNLNIEKIAFKYVQMKSLHITNQSNVLNIFTEHDLNILMIFGLKEKSIILTHDVLLAIASSIPVLLKTGVVVQGHILLDWGYGLQV